MNIPAAVLLRSKRGRRCRDDLVNNKDITHQRTEEYASYIIEAMETNKPFKIGGNVLNNGLITNLPKGSMC